MKNILLVLFSFIIAAVVMTGCNSQELSDNPISNQSKDIGRIVKHNAELQQELALARSSTAQYHNIDKAIEDGYVDINVVVQNMGYHLLKGENIDGTFDPGKPPLLVYSKNPVNGKMRLVAVEYAVPYDDNNPYPPEGFAGDEDVWEHDPYAGLWECHAWIWYNNPDGIFNEHNSRVHVDEGDVNYPPGS